MFGRFWSTLWSVIFKPSQFFATNATKLLSQGGVSSALVFAVIIQWGASFFNFLWRSAIGATIETRLLDLFRIASNVLDVRQIQLHISSSENFDTLRSRAMDFLFSAGAVILTPFSTLLKLFCSALLIHAAVRLFMKEELYRPHRYSTTLKILAYCSAPWILCVIPGVGILLAWILSFFAAVTGLREVYHTTTGRATLAIVFPELLFLALVFVSIFLLLFLAFDVMHLLF